MSNGLDLRHEGQAAVLAADTAPHRGYSEYVQQALDILTRTPDTFNPDDVRATAADLMALEGVEIQPHSPNVLPAVIGGWVKAGRIERVAEYHSGRKTRRYGRNGVYQRTA